MENKRLSNKLNSWFWFILTILPIIMLFIVFIFGLPKFAKYFDWDNNNWFDFIDYTINYDENFELTFSVFNRMSIPYIFNTFNQLFNRTFSISNYTALSYLFGWMLSVQFYHLIYDVLKFIIEWCHNLIEKAY